MKPLRIVQVLPEMRRAGAESVAANLCAGLAALGVESHLLVIGSRFDYPELLTAGATLRVHRLNLFSGAVRFYRQDLHWRIRRALQEFFATLKPDVAHFHLPRALIWGGGAACAAGARCFYTAHGLDPDLYAPGVIPRHRRGLLLDALTRSRAQLLAVSAPVAEHTSHGLAWPEVTIQPNPVALNFFTPAPRPRAVTPPSALMLGTLYPLKRVAVGIRATALLQRTCPFDLVVAGDGPERERLVTLAAGLGLGERVRFPGAVNDPAPLVARSGMLWLLSEREGQPMAALEAMAAGIPVIASAVPGTRELIRHEENGLLVPLDDPDAVAQAATRLLHDAELAARLIAGGRESARNAHPEQVARRHLEHYMLELTPP